MTPQQKATDTGTLLFTSAFLLISVVMAFAAGVIVRDIGADNAAYVTAHVGCR